ncbi:MAG: ligase-associated DNA damage response endonuclease PdeM [Pseudomonadota bacterium]
MTAVMVEVGEARRARLNGAELILHVSGAVWWPEAQTLAVADLHLEKGSAFAERGRPLPPYDSAVTLDRLAALVARFHPRRVVCLGDSFHDGGAGDRLPAPLGETLASLARACDWVWILGNHDPAPLESWGGRTLPVLTEGPLQFRHEAEDRHTAGEVSGHFHPKAGISWRGRRVTGRCFVEDGRRLILPAFGAYAGGLDARDPAIAGLFPKGFRVHIAGRDKLHSFSGDAL